MISFAVGDKDFQEAYEKSEIPLAGLNKPWFKGPIKDGKIHVTDLYTSKITGLLIMTVSAPVFDKTGGIIGVMGLDIRFQELERAEDEEKFLLGEKEEVPEYVEETN